jgi:two-component system, cell cycle sensor histidine kinase and response regulator CckA
MLESFGYTVLTARDAADALKILEDHERPVHLMLTDVVMPRMSGPELAARVAVIRPEIKILFSSGHTDNAALRASVLDNEARFIGKPYAKADLMRKVRQVLDSEPTAEGKRATAVAATTGRRNGDRAESRCAERNGG